MPKPKVQALILDMDGTITKPIIDWRSLRAEIGVAPDCTIMDHINSLPTGEHKRAETILLETEYRAAEDAELNDGFTQLLEAITARGIRTALVTNNHQAAMELVLSGLNLSFDIALNREDGDLKPSPVLIDLALKHLDCEPENALGVGDSHLDMAACRAANVTCLYLTHGSPRFEHTPSISALRDVIPYL